MLFFHEKLRTQSFGYQEAVLGRKEVGTRDCSSPVHASHHELFLISVLVCFMEEETKAHRG